MKYNVYALYEATKYLGTVEAASKEEAEGKANGLNTDVSLYHQCTQQIDVGDLNEIIVEPAERETESDDD